MNFSWIVRFQNQHYAGKENMIIESRWRDTYFFKFLGSKVLSRSGFMQSFKFLSNCVSWFVVMAGALTI